MPTKTISIRITPENYASLQELARRNGITVHAVIHAALADALWEHNIYWKPPPRGRPKKKKTEPA